MGEKLAFRIEYKCEPQGKSSRRKRTVIFLTAFGAMGQEWPIWVCSRPVEWEPPDGSYRSTKAPPFGFTQLSEWHVPNLAEQQAVTAMHDSRQAGLSLPAICSKLQDMKMKPRHGKIWRISTLHKILKRE